MKSPLLIFLLLLALSLGACSLFDRNPRPEPTLPAVTAEGAGTFGCLIDDRLYLPSSWNYLKPPLSVSYDSAEDVLFIVTHRFRRRDSVNEGFEFLLSNPTVGDTLWLGNEEIRDESDLPHRFAYYLDFQNSNYLGTWREDSVRYSGYVLLSNLQVGSNEDLRLAAGTFAFMARDTTSNTLMEISEGRFDLTLD